MKRLSVVMLAAAHLSVCAMMDEYAQARLDLQKKMFTYLLPLKLFLERIDTQDWETIDDQTALTLRALDKPLHAVIVAHDKQKIKAHKAWMLSQCKPEPVIDKIPTVLIDQQGIIRIEPESKYNNFSRKIKINANPDECLIGTREWRLEPHSLMIGPSGNSLQGEIYYSETLPGPLGNKAYFISVQFPLYHDGSISVPAMKPMQRLNKNVRIYNKEFCSLYKHDATYSHFCSVEYVYEEPNRGHIIVGGSGSHYVHKDGFFRAGTYDVQFHDDEISVFVRDGTHGFKGEHPYHRVSIEYRFTKGGKRCDHYKHVIASLSKPHKSLSLANFEFLPYLHNYLKICPTTITEATQPTTFLAFPVRVVTHHYKPTDAWPSELFERAMKITKRLAASNNGKHICDLLKEWPRDKVSDFVQVALLSGEYVHHLCYVLGERCRMQRCNSASLFCDYSGCLYYKKSHASSWVNLPNPIGPVPPPPLCLTTFPILHDWVTCVTKETVALEDSLQYLMDNKKNALKLTPAELITLFETRAKQHAQKTWDNLKIGALWEFDTDGMRINLYDLQRKNAHLIGTYLAQGRTDGAVTHVEYVPDTQPIVYIDGQQVDV